MAESNPDELGLLDTSIFIATESGRALGTLPTAGTISIVTIAELHLGVLMADRSAVRQRRLRTLLSVQDLFEAIPIDNEVARTFAEIVAEARRQTTADNGHLDCCDRRRTQPAALHPGRRLPFDSPSPRDARIELPRAALFRS